MVGSSIRYLVMWATSDRYLWNSKSTGRDIDTSGDFEVLLRRLLDELLEALSLSDLATLALLESRVLRGRIRQQVLIDQCKEVGRRRRRQCMECRGCFRRQPEDHLRITALD